MQTVHSNKRINTFVSHSISRLKTKEAIFRCTFFFTALQNEAKIKPVQSEREKGTQRVYIQLQVRLMPHLSRHEKKSKSRNKKQVHVYISSKEDISGGVKSRIRKTV